MSDPLDKLRIDKWLWAARFYKTRSLATDAVESGKARLNGERVKPAKDVKPGDTVTVRAGELEWTVAVLALSARRGPASEAALLYRESDESKKKREDRIAMRHAGPQPVAQGLGRPTKRERRSLDRFKRGEL